MFFLSSSDIFLDLKILLNSLVSYATPYSPIHFQTLIRIPFGPIALPLSILLRASFTYPIQILQ